MKTLSIIGKTVFYTVWAAATIALMMLTWPY